MTVWFVVTDWANEGDSEMEISDVFTSRESVDRKFKEIITDFQLNNLWWEQEALLDKDHEHYDTEFTSDIYYIAERGNYSERHTLVSIYEKELFN